MKVVAINGSPRKEGNTFILLNYVILELEREGIEVKLIQTTGLKLEGCNACRCCFRNKDKKCVIKDDMQPIIDDILESDGIILGSPTYFGDITPEIKAIIDRTGIVSTANGGLLKRKLGAAVIADVIAVGKGGAVHGFDTINNFFLVNSMIIHGSTYWNFGIGLERGDVEKDVESITTMQNLGINFAWLLKKLKN